MAGLVPLSPQIEESKVLDFDRSETFVGFLLDICESDIDFLKKYYDVALKKSLHIRQSNTMRVRQNDKYLNFLEEDIARLENRWVLPLTKASNIFDSAIQFVDVPPKDVKPGAPDSGVEITQVKKTDIQIKKRWIDEPAIALLKGVGVRPYKEAMQRLRDLRHRRSQYKYLEVYFLHIGRQVLNLQSNLRLIIAVIDVVKKVRNRADLAGNPIGQIVKEVISSNSLDGAVDKLHNLNIDQMFGKGGKGGPAGNPDAASTSPMTRTTGQKDTTQPGTNNSDAMKRQTSGDVPGKTINPQSVGPTGVSNDTQRSPRNTR